MNALTPTTELIRLAILQFIERAVDFNHGEPDVFALELAENIDAVFDSDATAQDAELGRKVREMRDEINKANCACDCHGFPSYAECARMACQKVVAAIDALPAPPVAASGAEGDGR